MSNRFNALGATASPAGSTNLVTAGAGAAVDTLTTITQIISVLTSQANTFSLPGAGSNVFTVTSSQPLVIRESGGAAGSAELDIWDDGSQVILQRGTSAQNRIQLNTNITLNGGDGTAYFTLNGSQQLTTRNGLGIQNGGANGSGIVSVVAGVVAPATSIANAASNTAGGWLQNTGGDLTLASNYTNATAGLTNTNLSWTVIAGRSYLIEGELEVSNSTAGEGAQFDFGGGSCSATTFVVNAVVVGTATAGTVRSTSLTTVVNWSSVTSTISIDRKSVV